MDDSEHLMDAAMAIWHLAAFVWGLSPIGVSFVVFMLVVMGIVKWLSPRNDNEEHG